MPNDRQKSEIKVTDKRIFTADGEIREEFRGEIQPSAPDATPPPRAPEPPRATTAAEPKVERRTQHEGVPHGGERRRTMADKAKNPGTPFANFLESLIAQAYMSLGMLPSPYQAQMKPDPAAAREMIEILSILQAKTAGNLTPEEEDFLSTHLGELKLAFVQRTKSL